MIKSHVLYQLSYALPGAHLGHRGAAFQAKTAAVNGRSAIRAVDVAPPVRFARSSGPESCEFERRFAPKESAMPIVNRIADFHDEIKAWRQDIHAHPELLFDVHRTAGVVAEKLKSFGCDEVVTGIGRTGVVGVIRGKKGGGTRTIGLRADMDALPIEEATGLVLQVAERRQDARLRPRRPHRHAARRREISRRDAQLRRHRGGDLPAGRRGRRRRPRDGQRRHDGPLPDRGGLRDAQLSRLPDRRLRHPVRPDDGGGRPHLHRHRRASAATRRGRTPRSTPWWWARRSSTRCSRSCRATSIRWNRRWSRSPSSTPAPPTTSFRRPRICAARREA